jgi:carboxylesterase
LLVQKNVSAETRMVVLEDSYHLITIDREYKTVIEESVAFFMETALNRTQKIAEHIAA